MHARVRDSRRVPPEGIVSRVQAQTQWDSLLGLQRTVGNRATTRLLQRVPDPKRPTIVERTRAFRRGITRAQELRQIADGFIEQELGSKPARGVRARRNGLAEIARRGGPRADVARRLGKALADIEAELDKRAREVVSVIDDFIESRLGARPKTPRARDSALATLRGWPGEVAEQAAGLEKQLAEIEAELTARQPAAAPTSKFAHAGTAAAKGEKAGKPPPQPSKPPQASAPSAKPAPATAAGGGSKVVKEGGEAAAEAVPKLYKRLAEKLGRELVDGLIPDPLDALELMYDFAGSYKEAWDRIKRDNVTSGFAVGLAAYLVVPRWEWVKHHALTTVSRGVVTQVLGAVGIAENAFNEGLVRGFVYGEKHSPAQADKLRQRAFNALLKAERTAGRYEGDDVWTFGRDDVYTFAGALYPLAVSVLKEADRRKAARLAAEAEKRRKDLGLPPPGRAAYKPL